MINETTAITSQEDTIETTSPNPQKTTGTTQLLSLLTEQEILDVFTAPNDLLNPLIQTIKQQTALAPTLLQSDASAAWAASSYARATGKIGCLLIASDPGFKNALHGINDALINSVPLLILAGQTPENKRKRGIFEEYAISDAAKAFTKKSVAVTALKDLPATMRSMIALAQKEPRGPVLIEIAPTLLTAHGLLPPLKKTPFTLVTAPQTAPSSPALDETIERITQAKRPVILTGRDLVNSGPAARTNLKQLIDLTDAPVATTLMGVSAIPTTNHHALGLISPTKDNKATRALREADLIISIGVPPTEQAPINRKNANLIQMNPLTTEGRLALTALIAHLPKRRRPQWLQTINEWPAPAEKPSAEAHLIKTLYRKAAELSKNVYVTADIKTNQTAAADAYESDETGRFIISGASTFGFGLPAAIGVQTAHPEALVLCVTNDYSTPLNAQEMERAVTQALPIKVFSLTANGERRENPKTCEWDIYRCETMSDLEKNLEPFLTSQTPAILDYHIRSKDTKAQLTQAHRL